MPEIRLTKLSPNGWPGAWRNDLPAYNRYGDIDNGDLSQTSVNPLRANMGAKGDAYTSRNPTYQYVDTDFSAVHQTNVLWSDSASWCTIVTLWSMNRAGLAHIPPGTAGDIPAFLTLFGNIPSEIHLATMPEHFDKEDGFPSVHKAIKTYYGNNYGAIKVFLITGYNGHDWAQKHQLAVDPKSGAYPVFN